MFSDVSKPHQKVESATSGKHMALAAKGEDNWLSAVQEPQDRVAKPNC